MKKVGSRESGNPSFARRKNSLQEEIGGLPFLSNESTNSKSKGLVDEPVNVLTSEQQEEILFKIPGGNSW